MLLDFLGKSNISPPQTAIVNSTTVVIIFQPSEV